MATRYRNPQTGEEIEWNGSQWTPVAKLSPGEQATNWLGGVGRSLRQGGTFGWGDELTAAIASGVFPKLFGQELRPGAYERIRRAEEVAQREFAQENPITALGSNIAGGMATGGPIGKAIGGVAAPLLARIPGWLQGAAAGGTAGAVGGAGEAQPGARDMGALVGGVAGSLAGGATDLIAKYGGKFINWARDKYFTKPGTKASREVYEALQREGMSPADAETLIRSYGDDAVLADAGGRVRTLAAGVEALPEAPRRGYENFLRERHAAQQDQLMGAIEGATGRSGKTLSYQQALEAARKGATRPLYERAYQSPTSLTDTLSDALTLPQVQNAYRQGHKIAEMEAGKRLPRLSWDEKGQQWINPPTTQEWDWINRGLRAIQERNLRGGSRDVAKAYGDLRGKILNELDSANPVFGEARKAHATGKQIEEALDAGKGFFREKDDELLAMQFNGLSDPEKGAYLEGVVNAIRQRVRAVGKNKDVTTASWLRSPEFQDRMTMLFGQDAAEQVFKKVETLAEKAITKNQILHQSMTADKTAIREELAGADLGDVARSALSGDVRGAFEATRRAFNAQPKVDPAVAAETAKLLLTPVNQWQGPLASQFAGAQLSPFWQRRAAGEVPGLLPFITGEQMGLLPQWFDPLEGGMR